VNTGGTFDLNGQDEGIGKLLGGGTVTNTAAGTNPMLTVGAADNGSFTFSGTVQDGPGGTVSIFKAGLGTLTLTGTSTYSGLTSIGDGKVVVDGSIANSTVIVGGGTVLGGHGTVGAVNVYGTLSPGNSPGTLTTASETWNPGASYVWELNHASDAGAAKGVSYDWLNINGTLDLAATTESKFTVYVTSLTAGNAAGDAPGFSPDTTYHWIIASATSVTGFSADEFLIDTSGFSNDPANAGNFTISQVGNDLVLSYTAVPEPAGWGIVLGVALLGTVLVRRRNLSRR
jgi:autotransporter-associated beta strand protein